MNTYIQNWVIIGSSRGLGAAFVAELLQQPASQVIGVARTGAELIPAYPQWQETGRYRHLQLDISSPHAKEALRAIAREVAPAAVGVIFNAAHVEQDMNPDHTLKYEVFERINQVNIGGLGHVLAAFEAHFFTYGGLLVGISSFWGSVPPLFLPWIAYPASKAYLNNAFRCLRIAWCNHVPVTLVHLGKIEAAEKKTSPHWLIPTYTMAAKKIAPILLRASVPKTINYPFWHGLVYRYFLRFVPEIVYSWVFQLYFTLDAIRRKTKS